MEVFVFGQVGPGWMADLDFLRLEVLGRLALATVLGAAIGLERARSGKPAGLRTNILICVGAALLTEISIVITFFGAPTTQPDPARISAQIVSGIGFLGAGTIIQSRGHVTGLTTAATLWVVAAIGIAVGGRAYVEAIGATLLVLLILAPMTWVEGLLEERRLRRPIAFQLQNVPGVVERIQRVMDDAGFKSRCSRVDKQDDTIYAVFEIQGEERAFRRVRSDLVKLDEVRGFNME